MTLLGKSRKQEQMGHWKKSNVKNLATLSLKRATCLSYTAVNKQLTILGSPEGQSELLLSDSALSAILKIHLCLFILYRPMFQSPCGLMMTFRRAHCKENPFYVFLFWELRGLSPNFNIHVSVSDLDFPRIGPHISLQ